MSFEIENFDIEDGDTCKACGEWMEPGEETAHTAHCERCEQEYVCAGKGRGLCSDCITLTSD